ncbi:tumor necrosis factor receptor superfamily member 5 [Cyclopterus lumpus]|uniref:tumor necrosis factor receptor superfamily member 5 n=1 Tax=Cyclopterus lumpus TaxID=8103 RepID=UPI001486C53C|nr:tumor necrosis factor receptor superfamily member 5 [Cyclopterus lumpus]
MGLVQCFVILSMLSARLALTFPLTDGTQYYAVGGRLCQMCLAGEYQKSCTECVSCPAGHYTTELNREPTCHPCYGDCRPDFHLKVVHNCTRETNVRCVCDDGFICTDMVPYSANCRYCVQIQETTTTEVAAVISGNDKHTPSSASSGHGSTSAKPCQLPKCGPQSGQPAGNGTHLKGGEDKTNNELAAILSPGVAVGCVALVILLCVRRPRDETCFKQAIINVCNKGGRDASHKTTDSTHQLPRDSFSAKQQPPFLSAANLGPVHVHNPGTVIFSLLSQFTGQVGPTIECGKTAEGVISEEEDEKHFPVFPQTSSPSIHLSEEERSGEIDIVFFPSQEQGKDFHMSKEESL